MALDENGWDEYKRMILNELKNLHGKVDTLSSALSETREEIAALKVKSGIWGAIAGVIPAALVLFYFLAH